jgi:hypothetical protein
MSTVTSGHDKELEWALARTHGRGRRRRRAVTQAGDDRRGRGAAAVAADRAGAAAAPARARRGRDVSARPVGTDGRTDGRFVYRHLWVSTLG